MTYKFHIATNSNSMVNTLGWLCVLASIALFFASSKVPSPILLLLVGSSIVWLTTKKKIVKIDTDSKELQLDDTVTYSNPERIFINRNRESQVINSRTQTTTVYTMYYTAYFVADGKSYLISKNKKVETDLTELRRLATDLNIEIEEMYNLPI